MCFVLLPVSGSRRKIGGGSFANRWEWRGKKSWYKVSVSKGGDAFAKVMKKIGHINSSREELPTVGRYCAPSGGSSLFPSCGWEKNSTVGFITIFLEARHWARCRELPFRVWLFSLIDKVITKSGYNRCNHFVITGRWSETSGQCLLQGTGLVSISSLPFLLSAAASCVQTQLLRAWLFSFMGAVPVPAAPTSAIARWGHPRAPTPSPPPPRAWQQRSERPVPSACTAFGCVGGCHWAAPCQRCWQVWDYNSWCSKPGIIPAGLKLGVEGSKEPKTWVRGQRWRVELGKAGKLALGAGFGAEAVNSREMCCCRSQLCNFLFFLTQLVLNKMRGRSSFWI